MVEIVLIVSAVQRKDTVSAAEPGLPRHRNCSESTSTSAILNKKNSFKIPVKTLNGEHKLFSAPLLLLKTKPVFVVTRKIEDKHGDNDAVSIGAWSLSWLSLSLLQATSTPRT